MINISKSTQNHPNNQIAGLLLGDYNGEFIGVKKTKEVLFLHNGHTLSWNLIPKKVYEKCKKRFLNDKKAVLDLSKQSSSLDRQIELFIYHSYGDVDNSPDLLNGELTPSENYRHTENCSSLNWDTKWITIDGIKLNDRDLIIIDLIKKDYPDKAIASKMNIALSTFDFHKRNLYQKFNVQSKTALLIKAIKQNV